MNHLQIQDDACEWEMTSASRSFNFTKKKKCFSCGFMDHWKSSKMSEKKRTEWH